MPYPIHKKKVIVYTSRKVGSESLWRFVHDLDFPDEDYQDWKTTQTARRMTAPIFKPMCEDYWKVALVRDPIERLHSCYRHRVVNTTTLFRDLDPVDGETDPTRPQTPEECVRIIQGAGLEIDPSFSFFAKNLDAYAAISANLAKHVAPQSLALGDLSWYDEVLTLDRLNELGATAWSGHAAYAPNAEIADDRPRFSRCI